MMVLIFSIPGFYLAWTSVYSRPRVDQDDRITSHFLALYYFIANNEREDIRRQESIFLQPAILIEIFVTQNFIPCTPFSTYVVFPKVRNT